MKHILSGLMFTLVIAAIGFGAYFLWKPNNKHDKGAAPESALILDVLEKGAIDFEMKDIEGKPFKLSDFKGKVIILSFWASWCDPCVEEFPSMIKLIERFKGEVVLIALSADYEMEELEKFLKVFKIDSDHLVVAWDKDKSIATKYKVQALPESYLFGKDHKLIRKISGADNWYTDDAIEFFESLVSK